MILAFLSNASRGSRREGREGRGGVVEGETKRSVSPNRQHRPSRRLGAAKMASYKAHLESLLAGASPSASSISCVPPQLFGPSLCADGRAPSPLQRLDISALWSPPTVHPLSSPVSAPLPPLPPSGGLPPFAWTWRSTLLPPASPPRPPLPAPEPVALVPKHLQEDEQFLSVFRAQQARASGAALANLKEAAIAEEEYPHVYQATKMTGLKGLSYGGRLALPMGTTREEWPVRHLHRQRTRLSHKPPADLRTLTSSVSTKAHEEGP
jgi:hypothetical protein